jgi:hypothetical protein
VDRPGSAFGRAPLMATCAQRFSSWVPSPLAGLSLNHKSPL